MLLLKHTVDYRLVAIWVAYLLLSIWSLKRAQASQTVSTAQTYSEQLGFSALFIAHSTLCWEILDTAATVFGAREALILLAWLVIAIYCLANFFAPLEGLTLAIFPIATLSLGLSLLLSAQAHPIPIFTYLSKIHFVVAMLAYGFFAVAVGLACLMWLSERQLRKNNNVLINQLPPLLSLEKLLFGMLWLGLSLLSLTLLSGSMLFFDLLLGYRAGLWHKTVFSLLAWLIFVLLLIGRYHRGWRGRIAIHATLLGSGLLFLAYIGNRFVFENIFPR